MYLSLTSSFLEAPRPLAPQPRCEPSSRGAPAASDPLGQAPSHVASPGSLSSSLSVGCSWAILSLFPEASSRAPVRPLRCALAPAAPHFLPLSPHPGHLTLFPTAMEGPPSELRALNCVTARCAALLSPLPVAGHLLPHPQSPQPPNRTPADPAQSLCLSLCWSLCRCCEAPSVLPGPFPAQCPTQLHLHSPQRTLEAQREAALCAGRVCTNRSFGVLGLDLGSFMGEITAIVCP